MLAAAAFVATLLPGVAFAQADSRSYRVTPPADRGFTYSFGDDDDANRAVIGISTSGGSARDTLGVLVTEVTTGGPAERAGIEEGNRIAAVNGVNLRLAVADTGDWDMSGLMTRRLTRELGKVKPGDEVELRLYVGGQMKTTRVKTVPYDSLYTHFRMTRDDMDNRAVLGISLGSTGSRRDTSGVLIMSVDDEGPAAKAGILEGNRIAAVNGVDVRVRAEDAGDDYVSGAKVERLRRELQKLKPGDEVELKLYGDGRTRTVRVKTVAASTLQSHSSMRYFGPGGFAFPRVEGMIAPMPPMPPMPSMPRRTRMRVSTATSM
jgi:S1-C subfamily serine protease